MADVTFPTLSRGVSFQNFREGIAYDPTIKSEMENGLVLTRTRFTALDNEFFIGYNFLTAADKILLKTMQTAVHVGAGTIDWTNPDDAVVYEVRLVLPIKFQIESTDHTKWSARIEFVET